VGTRQVILVDEADEEGMYGRMQRDAPEIDGQVLIESGRADIGRFVEVEITGADPYQLQARAVGEPF
jgi:tRNA A37 methylthiotransferase MiaB